MGKIPDDLREIIADNIRKCRIRKFPGRGGSKKCAEAFGVSPQQWSPWERGMRTPDENRMKQIAAFFEVTVAYLRQDRRHIYSDSSSHFQPPPDSPTEWQSFLPPPNTGEFTTPPFDGMPRNDSSSPFGELPQLGVTPQPEAPPKAGVASQSGTDIHRLLAKFFSNVSHNGILIRLAVQDMDYLGDCIAQALVRRGVVVPPRG